MRPAQFGEGAAAVHRPDQAEEGFERSRDNSESAPDVGQSRLVELGHIGRCRVVEIDWKVAGRLTRLCSRRLRLGDANRVAECVDDVDNGHDGNQLSVRCSVDGLDSIVCPGAADPAGIGCEPVNHVDDIRIELCYALVVSVNRRGRQRLAAATRTRRKPWPP